MAGSVGVKMKNFLQKNEDFSKKMKDFLQFFNCIFFSFFYVMMTL